MTSENVATNADSYVFIDNPSTNYGTSTELVIGEAASNTSDYYRSMIGFDFSSLSGILLSAVTLYLYHKSEDADNNNTIAVYRNTTTWTELGVTWSNQPTYDGTSVGSRSFSSTESDGWKSFTLTASVVQDMIDGVYNNYGFTLKSTAESNDEHIFHSRNYDSGSLAAYLALTYIYKGRVFFVPPLIGA